MVSNYNFLVSFLALHRLGYIPFLLSPRLSIEAARILRDHLGSKKTIFSSALGTLARNINDEEECFEVPESNIWLEAGHVPNINIPIHSNELAMDRFAYFHSSGSKGVPRPICMNCETVFHFSLLDHKDRVFFVAPLFHILGFMVFVKSIIQGCRCTSFDFARTPVSTSIIRALNIVLPKELIFVPFLLKEVMALPDGITALQRLQSVGTGGATVPDLLIRKCFESHIPLVQYYGATEFGSFMHTPGPEESETRNWLRVYEKCIPFVQWNPIGDNIYELVISKLSPNVLVINSKDGFRTRDLFVKHPSVENAWKYYCRVDDRITLINGEKVLPLAMEQTLRTDKLIKQAVVFGIGKQLPGVAIIPAGRVEARELFLDSIWKTIELVNSKAESFSQLTRDMILLLPFDVEYPQTDKGTVKRQQFYNQFGDQIEQTYEILHDEIETKLDRAPNE
jgi:acyl-coenzyme A synthetase/AMP-(fatty) acid ligase